MEIEKTTHTYLKSKLKRELKKLKAQLSEDFHTLYLLESIPILNNFHSINNDLRNATRDGLKSKISELNCQRSIIVSNYLRRFYPEYEKNLDIDRTSTFVNKNEDILCCGKACLQQDDCSIVCSVCGLVVANHTSIDRANPSRNLSYNRNISAASSFSYKRVNHLRELLRQIQGKTTSTMPEEAVERVYAELRKITLPKEKITSFTIRKILKKLRFHKYYDSTVALTMRINPKFVPIRISPEYEERLVFQFLQLEKPFSEVKSLVDKNRSNFLSYPIVFYRLNELNGREDLNRDVRLLKSVALVNRQDKLWRKVVEKLGWKYHGRTVRI